jgi:hypothetical protein
MCVFGRTLDHKTIRSKQKNGKMFDRSFPVKKN